MRTTSSVLANSPTTSIGGFRARKLTVIHPMWCMEEGIIVSWLGLLFYLYALRVLGFNSSEWTPGHITGVKYQPNSGAVSAGHRKSSQSEKIEYPGFEFVFPCEFDVVAMEVAVLVSETSGSRYYVLFLVGDQPVDTLYRCSDWGLKAVSVQSGLVQQSRPKSLGVRGVFGVRGATRGNWGFWGDSASLGEVFPDFVERKPSCLEFGNPNVSLPGFWLIPFVECHQK